MSVQLITLQLNSQEDIDANFVHIENLLLEHFLRVPVCNPTLVALPENAFCFAPGQQRQTAEQFELLHQRLAALAFRWKIYLVAGTLPCPFRPDGQPVPDGRVRATCLMFEPSGQCIGRYDKIHLFDVQVTDGIGHYQESAVYEPGQQIQCIATEWGKIGLMVCYDARFPELALTLRAQGADILTVPAAFTHRTGSLHWQVLLQARAIDTQCAIVGSAQMGWHGSRQTWGHSMIVDALGQIMGTLDTDTTGVLQREWDAVAQQQQRQQMPLLQHRKAFVWHEWIHAPL